MYRGGCPEGHLKPPFLTIENIKHDAADIMCGLVNIMHSAAYISQNVTDLLSAVAEIHIV